MKNDSRVHTEIGNNISWKQPSSNSNTIDVKRLMELICTTDDIELLIKLFNVLAVNLVSNDTCKGEIITNYNIYDKIRNVLNCGQSLKTVRTLNFITALLYLPEEETGPSKTKTLILYAQNMIRSSGCLSLMCNMFTSCMLHQETWRALCQCLAESCRNSTENQSYCSHLVPMAVQKCLRGNMEAMDTLKSLIYNHKYNTQLFLDSNGIKIFSRQETLMNDASMQLLSSVVQISSQEMLSLIHQTVFQNISHLKHLYGTQNRIGQWATIIWHQLNSRIKVTKVIQDQKDLNRDDRKQIVHNESSLIDIGFLKPDDTARLMQNVIREINYYNAKNNAFQKMGRHSNESIKKENFNGFNNHHINKSPTFNKEFDVTHKGKSLKQLDPNFNEMSFSFLLKAQSHSNIGLFKNKARRSSMMTVNPTATETSICFQMESKPTCVTTKHISQRDATMISCNNVDSSDLDFNPIFASTPKKNCDSYSNYIQKSSHSYYGQSTVHEVEKVIDNTKKTTRYHKNSKVKQKRNFKNKSLTSVKQRTDLKNRSMTSRLFHAINDSCTTFVKTVTNIFKSKKNNDVRNQSTGRAENSKISNEDSCSYSFTDYMRKRDALLSNETAASKSNFTEINIKSCKTCDDTVSLKHKVNNDQYLKETVKKLKLGINMYGCDFKKISKSMWPRETYMTPEVLYNLYRKLIVK